ncbi:M48 family metallopeptidase [Dyadobacter sp. CY312]|uniref:tetratricopeptide repeat protein n=1 Tax=Dyadobacter sp. CY312 TaxID=2907303 RepID=UPI001F441E5D|nr:tetratricopeptide repeat protein [Dyadobacter sp. CY312]MCE7042335.1 tetratricopeptide repeat protein [Dyadobacter sp. CY312]
MKDSFVIWLALLIPAFSMAQETHLASAGPASDTNVASKRPLELKERRILPLFGELSKTSDQIDEEIRFLSECDKSFTTRTEASSFFTARAWEYLQEGALDTACYRFNLAHLLDDKNVEPYWGLGVVSYQRQNWVDAKKMLSRGVELQGNNVALLVDLSTVDLKLFELTKRKEELDEAATVLKHATSLDSTYALGQYNMALVHYNLDDPDKAWESLHNGRKLDFGQINLDFVELLKARKPDPLGFFK